MKPLMTSRWSAPCIAIRRIISRPCWKGATGKPLRQFEHPCLGSWVSYALGTANKDLPTFVNIGRPSSPVQLSGGYLGASYSATPFQPGDMPIPNLLAAEEFEPAGSATAKCRRSSNWINNSARTMRSRAKLPAARASFELAASMMMKAPAIVDFSTEPDHVKRTVWHRRQRDRRFRTAATAGPPSGGEWRPVYPDLPCGRRQRRMGRARRYEDPCAALPCGGQADLRSDPRSEAARDAGQHAGCFHERIRHARRGRRTPRAATTMRWGSLRCWRAAA